jgi:hypothetical protein
LRDLDIRADPTEKKPKKNLTLRVNEFEEALTTAEAKE